MGSISQLVNSDHPHALSVPVASSDGSTDAQTTVDRDSVVGMSRTRERRGCGMASWDGARYGHSFRATRIQQLDE